MNKGQLETVAIFPDERPGNPTVMRDGRVLVSISAIIAPEFAVRAIASDGNHTPIPMSSGPASHGPMAEGWLA